VGIGEGERGGGEEVRVTPFEKHLPPITMEVCGGGGMKGSGWQNQL